MSEPPPDEHVDVGQLTGDSPAKRLTVAELKNEVVKARRGMVPFAKVGQQLGITGQYAHQLYWRAMREVRDPAVTEIRAEQNRNLEFLLEQAHQILARDHVALSGGTIVRDAEGNPVLDDGPRLRAIAEARALEETRAKLNGTQAPAQVTVNGTISYDVAGIDLKELQ